MRANCRYSSVPFYLHYNPAGENVKPEIFLPSLHISGHQTGESLLQVIRDIFAVRKDHKTGGNLGILHEKMIWTLFRIINLHPMQISITSQAIRKSLKRASTRSESHRAIVHFYYVFHSAYSYLSFFLADRVSISYPHTFSEISKIFAEIAGVSGIGAKKWVDGKVDGDLLGKPASPCALGVSAGRHRVDMGGFEQNGSSKCTKKRPSALFSKGLIFRSSRSAFFRTSDRSIRPFRRCAAHGNRCRRSTSHICVPCRRGGPSLRAGRSASAPTTA